jgi:hypothetical protein
MGLFSKTSTYDPMSAYTLEQRKAVEALMSLASTGTGGGITLGQQYGGDLGYYQQGEQGLAGGTALENLLTQFTTGTGNAGKAQDIYQGFADLGKFNPDDPKWGYAAFNKALAKSGAESASALEREAAIGGRRFGSSIQGEKADLAENLNLQRQSALANIFQSSQQFAALGAQGFTNLANQTADIAGLNINYDDYQRQLKDQQAKDQYNEFKRTRDEELSRLNLMQNQWENPMGTITKKGPSTFAKLLGEVVPLMGSYNTHKYGYTQGQTSIGDTIAAAVKVLSGGTTNGGFGSSKSSSSNDSIQKLLELLQDGGK